MLYAAPFFVVDGVVGGRARRAARSRAADWRALVGLGFVGYYLASLLDFVGLQYITAALERLVLYLYPTMVVLLSAVVLLGKPIGAARCSRWRSRTPASCWCSGTTCA